MKKIDVFFLKINKIFFCFVASTAICIWPQRVECLERLKQQISADVIDKNLKIITQRIKDKKIQDALNLTLKLKEQSPNDIKIREILFEIYLKKNLIELAEKELFFLEATNKDTQTLYRRAFLLKLQGKIKESKNLTQKILNEDNQFILAHLLMADLLRMEKLFSKSRFHLDIYEQRKKKNKDFLLLSTSLEADIQENKDYFEKRQIKKNLLRMEEELREYLKKIGEDTEYHILKSRYHFLLEEYAKALENIEKALFLNTNHEELKKQKIMILFFQKNISGLINYLEKQNDWNEKKDLKKHLYLLGFLHFAKEKVKGSDWEIADKKYLLRKILPPLLKANKLEPEDEKIQFFIESLLRKNLELSHPIRLYFAKKHLKKALDFLNFGEKEKARYAFLRAINLSPQHVSIRKSYIKYLQKEKIFQALREEMLILKTLDSKEFLNDYKSTTLLDLLEKKQKESLIYKEKINPQTIVQEEKNKILLLYKNISWQEQWPFPYQRIIARDLIKEKLSYSHLFRVEISSISRMNHNLNKKNYDYYMNIDAEEKKEQLKISIKISDTTSRKEKFLYNSSFRQNDRYQKVSTDIAQSIEKFIPKKGKILKINGYQIIFSLGKIHGVQKNDFFQIKKGNDVLGKFPILETDEKISMGEIKDFLLLPKIKLDDLVIAIKKAKPASKTRK